MSELIIPPYEDWWTAMRQDLKDLVGVPYRYGAEVDLKRWPPKAVDCSELVELVFARQGIPCPDGSAAQHKASYRSCNPRPGDLGFFFSDKRRRVNHVGIIFDKNTVVEARGKDGKGRYGKVIYRPRFNWENYMPFKVAGGWRRLKVLEEN